MPVRSRSLRSCRLALRCRSFSTPFEIRRASESNTGRTRTPPAPLEVRRNVGRLSYKPTAHTCAVEVSE